MGNDGLPGIRNVEVLRTSPATPEDITGVWIWCLVEQNRLGSFFRENGESQRWVGVEWLYLGSIVNLGSSKSKS
jgi:hypothetical protein